MCPGSTTGRSPIRRSMTCRLPRLSSTNGATAETPRQLYPKSIKPFTWLIVASRNQGKSHLFKHIWKTNLAKTKSGAPRFHAVVVMSTTLMTGQYDYLTESRNTRAYTEFDEDVVEELFNAQDRHREQTGKYLNILLLLDDVVDNATIKSSQLRRLFCTGRHYGISLAWLTQSPQFVKPVLRNNTTVLSVLRIKSNGREHIVRSFLADMVNSEGSRADAYARQLLVEAFRVPYRSLVVLFEEESHDMWTAIKVYLAP
jgi:hypothetical protein